MIHGRSRTVRMEQGTRRSRTATAISLGMELPKTSAGRSYCTPHFTLSQGHGTYELEVRRNCRVQRASRSFLLLIAFLPKFCKKAQCFAEARVGIKPPSCDQSSATSYQPRLP